MWHIIREEKDWGTFLVDLQQRSRGQEVTQFDPLGSGFGAPHEGSNLLARTVGGERYEGDIKLQRADAIRGGAMIGRRMHKFKTDFFGTQRTPHSYRVELTVYSSRRG